jgi:hypothetical protein
MKARFQPGDKVLQDKETVTVQASVKDFSTQKISYRIAETQDLVPEEALQGVDANGKPLPETKQANVLPEEDKGLEDGKTPIEKLREEYFELYGKLVPPNMKNNEEWMSIKIEERTIQNEDKDVTFELLEVMDEEQLENLIAEKELEIDIDDYDVEQLRIAVAEELGTAVPKK